MGGERVQEGGDEVSAEGVEAVAGAKSSEDDSRRTVSLVKSSMV